MVLIIPYLWFAAFLKSVEAEENERRKRFQNSKEELSRDGVSVDWISEFKDVKKRGVRRFTENEYVEVSVEWLLTWGVFLALEGFWAYSLYKGFVFIMTNVGDFLESWFYSG